MRISLLSSTSSVPTSGPAITTNFVGKLFIAETTVADSGAEEKSAMLVRPVVGEETVVGVFLSTTRDSTLSLKRSARMIETMLKINNHKTSRKPALTINSANSLTIHSHS